MGRQGPKVTSISQKGRVSVGGIPCYRHQGAVDFGLSRNDERAETNVPFILSLPKDPQQSISSMEWFYRITMNRWKESYQLYRIKGLARQGI